MTPAEKRKKDRLRLRHRLCSKISLNRTIPVSMVQEILDALIGLEAELEQAKKGKAPTTKGSRGFLRG